MKFSVSTFQSRFGMCLKGRECDSCKMIIFSRTCSQKLPKQKSEKKITQLPLYGVQNISAQIKVIIVYYHVILRN